MNETKPTPGPWLYEEGSKWVRGPELENGDKEIICEMGYANVRVPVEQVNANGRLIAASWDTLKACQFAFQALLDGDLDHAEIVAVLEVAIEKALGLQAETV